MPLASSQYPEVELPSPVITQQQVTSSAYQITDVNDNPVQKTVVARVKKQVKIETNILKN